MHVRILYRHPKYEIERSSFNIHCNQCMIYQQLSKYALVSCYKHDFHVVIRFHIIVYRTVYDGYLLYFKLYCSTYRYYESCFRVLIQTVSRYKCVYNTHERNNQLYRYLNYNLRIEIKHINYLSKCKCHYFGD